MKHYTIPFFIIHSGCPDQCVFCDQKNITGRVHVTPNEVDLTIKRSISTMDAAGSVIEVGFFGGTFTGIEKDMQKALMEPVRKYIDSGVINGIRLSTRPDFIDADTLKMLSEYHVTCIELGVQSMSDHVLKASKRGYGQKDVEIASRMIKEHGFRLGHQMMLGLPGSTEEDEYYTAKKAVGLGAVDVRIYPLVVIKGTELAVMMKDGFYAPLGEEEALERSAALLVFFAAMGVKVIRCGLHPSEGLISGTDIMAGPFHPAFRYRAESRIFGKILEHIIRTAGTPVGSLSCNPSDEGVFFGYERENAPLIRKMFRDAKIKVLRDTGVPRGYVMTGDGISCGAEDIAPYVLPEVLMEYTLKGKAAGKE